MATASANHSAPELRGRSAGGPFDWVVNGRRGRVGPSDVQRPFGGSPTGSHAVGDHDDLGQLLGGNHGGQAKDTEGGEGDEDGDLDGGLQRR